MQNWQALKLAIRFLHALGESEELLRNYIQDEGISYEQFDDMLTSLREQYVKAAYPNTRTVSDEKFTVVIFDHYKLSRENEPITMDDVAGAWHKAAQWVDEHPPE